jgi:prepilin-type N-terminal cleavage/methylation domain-containing protein
MTLNKIKTLKEERGFTIVELLIVIVVIAILAAIVIVAYNGIQNRAKTQSANASATVIQKKIEAYAAANSGSYPSATTVAAYTTALNTYTESSISSTGITLGTPTGVAGDEKKVEVSNCTAPSGATGYRVRYWDFGANPAAISTNTLTGNLNNTTCTTWTPLT